MASYIDSQILDIFRLSGLGWVLAFFVVGTCFLAGSWLINWQIRRIESIVARAKAEAGDGPDDATHAGGTGETPRA